LVRQRLTLAPLFDPPEMVLTLQTTGRKR
jgi:hypothetical protein